MCADFFFFFVTYDGLCSRRSEHMKVKRTVEGLFFGGGGGSRTDCGKTACVIDFVSAKGGWRGSLSFFEFVGVGSVFRGDGC